MKDTHTISVKPNTLQRLRVERGISVRDMVEVVAAIYPRYDKVLHSKCEHGEEYGIRLRADAERTLREHFALRGPEGARRPRRSKPYRVQVRLTETAYRLLQQAISRSGATVQDLIEGWILDYIKNSEVKEGAPQGRLGARTAAQPLRRPVAATRPCAGAGPTKEHGDAV